MNVTRITLGIESAIEGGSLSLWRGAQETADWSSDAGVARAEYLLPNIASILEANSIARTELGLIAVSTGPGSFTGIRIGLATVLGLKRSLDIRCVGLTSLEAIAYAVGSPVVAAAVPVGRKAAAIQVFKNGTAASAPRLVAESDLPNEFAGIDAGVAAVHSSLFPLIDGRLPGGMKTVDAGRNIATLLVAASSSSYARAELKPLFLSRNVAAVSKT